MERSGVCHGASSLDLSELSEFGLPFNQNELNGSNGSNHAQIMGQMDQVG